MTTELQMHGYSEMFLLHWTALCQQILYVGMATHQRGHKMKLDLGKHFTPKWRWMMEDGRWKMEQFEHFIWNRASGEVEYVQYIIIL